MNYDTMTIDSLSLDCHNRSGYKINKADLESRITHLCEQYHQSEVKNNVVLDSVVIPKGTLCCEGMCEEKATSIEYTETWYVCDTHST